jgi:hypothetical protein
MTKAILCAVCGLVVAWLPFIVYALLTNSLSDMIFCVFTYNMKYVSDGSLKIVIVTMIRALLAYKLFLFLILFELTFNPVKFTSKKHFYSFLFFWFSFGVTFFFAFVSGRGQIHYFLNVMPFFALLTGLVFRHIDILSKNKKITAAGFNLLVGASGILLFAASFQQISEAKKVINREQPVKEITEYIVRYKSAHPDADVSLTTALTISCAVYVNTGILPKNKYFYIPGTSYATFPVPIDFTYSYIEKEQPTFVVIPVCDYSQMPDTAIERLQFQFLNQFYRRVLIDGNLALYQFSVQ